MKVARRGELRSLCRRGLLRAGEARRRRARAPAAARLAPRAFSSQLKPWAGAALAPRQLPGRGRRRGASQRESRSQLATGFRATCGGGRAGQELRRVAPLTSLSLAFNGLNGL